PETNRIRGWCMFIEDTKAPEPARKPSLFDRTPRRVATSAALAVVCAAVVAWLVWRSADGWQVIAEHFRPAALGIAFAIYLVAVLIAGYAWHRIQRAVSGRGTLA